MAAVAKKKQSQSACINGLPWRRKGEIREWNASAGDFAFQIISPVVGTYRWTIMRGEEVIAADTTLGHAFWDATTAIQKFGQASATLAHIFNDDENTDKN